MVTIAKILVADFHNFKGLIISIPISILVAVFHTIRRVLTLLPIDQFDPIVLIGLVPSVVQKWSNKPSRFGTVKVLLDSILYKHVVYFYNLIVSSIMGRCLHQYLVPLAFKCLVHLIMISHKIVWHIRLQMTMQDAVNHIKDLFSILFPRPKRISDSISQTICFSGSSSMPRVHFDWPQELSHRPTLSFSSSLRRATPPILLLMQAISLSLRLRCFYCSSSSPNAFFQKKLCA